MLLALHLVIAGLACWRLTDILLGERIAEPLRKYGGYLMTCPRCLSVWTGAICTVALLTYPWANLPLALSWVYIWRAGRAGKSPLWESILNGTGNIVVAAVRTYHNPDAILQPSHNNRRGSR